MNSRQSAAARHGEDGDLAFAPIREIGALFRKRRLSPFELTKLMLERIERLNPKLNAFLTVSEEQALAQAKRAEGELLGRRSKKRDRGPLHGIPISLKDNIYTKGLRTTGGSAVLRDFVPLRDATIVRQLREAGAVLLGKTNLHEFAYGVTTNNPHFGPSRKHRDGYRRFGSNSGVALWSSGAEANAWAGERGRSDTAFADARLCRALRAERSGCGAAGRRAFRARARRALVASERGQTPQRRPAARRAERVFLRCAFSGGEMCD